jgi:nucleoside 2-deoxyribosyltransferase
LLLERQTVTIYLAGPLFSLGERRTNREFAALIEKELPSV